MCPIKKHLLGLNALPGKFLQPDQIRGCLFDGLGDKWQGQRVLVLIPDRTRSLPLPLLFRVLAEVLQDARQLDFMVALGTHPALSMDSLNRLVGITAEERATQYATVGLHNHAWDDLSALTQIGLINEEEIRLLAGERWHPSLPREVPVRINKAVLDYDHILILGPTFPHEVVGFSGGAKYLFPGISGPEMINATHWLGALSGVVGTIGIKDTPVRAMIHAAAKFITTPITLIALVVDGHDPSRANEVRRSGQALAGMFIGDHLAAWEAAVECSAQHHIRWCETPFQRVLSCAPPMYDELWTGAKAMYKLEPAVAIGGEVIIYAPHLEVVSHTHGKYIYEIGYHILPYFLQDWERFEHIPLGAIAHSTHLCGSGVMENGIEKANVKVTLASKIPPEDCARLNLGYLDPASINLAEWQNREDEGILYVPKAGEILYRLKK